MEEESKELDEAVIWVAQAAQALSDGVEGIPANRGYPYNEGFTVKKEDMLELRAALKRWKVATDAFLKSRGVHR